MDVPGRVSPGTHMKSTFFSRYALHILVVVFFLVPFAMRGARMSLERMKNDVKDWLPDDFAETRQLDWFRDHFAGEQFVVLTWPGCTGESAEFKTLLSKLRHREVPPSMRQPLSPAGDQPPAAEQPAADANPPAGEVDEATGVVLQRVKEGGPAPESAGEEESGLLGSDPRGENFIGETRELYVGDDYFENWGGLKEKWLHGGQDAWYYITPDGSLYHWKGGSDLPSAGYRMFERLITGKNNADAELVTVFKPADGAWYYADPRRLSARLFKGVTTGPGVLHQLTEEGGPLAKEADPEGLAVERLKGVLFGPDGQQTCMLITLTDIGRKDLRRVLGRELMGKPLGKLQEMARDSGINLDDLHLGGPPVDNVAIDEEGQITLFRLIWLCAAIGIGLSYVCFRSVKATIMVFFVGGVSAFTSLSIVYWSGDSVDAVLMSMPSLVYVLGLSGAVHIINYYRDSVEEGGVIGAPEKAISHGWKPCTLAAFTTALGLLSLYTSNILPIRKFGMYSALGVLATLILLFTYLPAALQLWPLPQRKRREPSEPTAHSLSGLFERFWTAVGNGIIRHNGWVVTGCLVAFAFFAFGLTKINTSVQLLKMFDGNAKIIRDYTWLENNLGRLVPMEMVVRVDPRMKRPPIEALGELTGDALLESRVQLNTLDRIEIVDRIQQVIKLELGDSGQDIVGTPMSVVTYVPPLPEPGGGFRSPRTAFNAALEHGRPQLLETDYLMDDLDDQSELWRISLRLDALKKDIDYGTFVGNLKQIVEPVITGYEVREQVLRDILKQDPQANFARKNVLLLGHSFQSAADITRAPGAAPSRARQTEIFAETLRDTLLNASFGNRRIGSHDPERTPFEPGYATSDEWAKQLAAIDCVVLVEDHPDYDLDFIRQHAKLVVDARQHTFDPATSPPTYDPTDSYDAEHQPPALAVVYSGVVPLVYKAQRTLLTSLIESIGWAFALIAVVMMLLLRSPSAGMVSMLPNVFPVVIIFGAMGYLKIAVDIGSMMTASVAMGVAVDDTIHFLTWFRLGLDKGMDRKQAILTAYSRCATAMFQTTAIGGLGLAVFAFSTFTPTQRFGTLMLSLLVAALVGDLLFLPAILAGPAGRVFGRRRTDDDQPSPDQTSESRTLEQAAAAVDSDQRVGTPHTAGRRDDPQAKRRHDRPHKPRS